jgi:multiple sugar transport system permease protein
VAIGTTSQAGPWRDPTGGGPGTATEILNLYAYRTSFSSFSLGYGSALATTLLVITVVLSVAFFRVRHGAR